MFGKGKKDQVFVEEIKELIKTCVCLLCWDWNNLILILNLESGVQDEPLYCHKDDHVGEKCKQSCSIQKTADTAYNAQNVFQSAQGTESHIGQNLVSLV